MYQKTIKTIKKEACRICNPQQICNSCKFYILKEWYEELEQSEKINQSQIRGKRVKSE